MVMRSACSFVPVVEIECGGRSVAELSATFAAAGTVGRDSSRLSNISEPPCTAIESNTKKQQMKNKSSASGTTAKTGTSTKRSELRPRGPNHAINIRLRKSNRVPEREIKNATGRIRSENRLKRATGQLKTVNPLQIRWAPKSTNVKSSAISAVVWPYSRKQSQSSTSSAAMVNPAANAARKPLPWTASAAA